MRVAQETAQRSVRGLEQGRAAAVQGNREAHLRGDAAVLVVGNREASVAPMEMNESRSRVLDSNARVCRQLFA